MTLKFTNGRTANHLLITDSGKVHFAADCNVRPYHVLACTGRAMVGGGIGLDAAKEHGNKPTCAACARLAVNARIAVAA